MVRGGARRAVLALILAPLLAACSRGVAVPPSTSTSTPPESSSTAAQTTTPAPASPELLRVAVPFDQPGLGMREDDEYSGIDVAVARYVAQQLGAQRLELLQAIPDQRETLLATGQADLVIATYSMTPERSEQVLFAGPYLVTGQDLLVPRGSKVRSVEHLRGQSVCGAAGSASVKRLVDDHPGLHIVERPTVGECVELLREREVGAVTSDTTILAGYLEADKDERSTLRLAGVDIGRESYGVGMSPDDEELCYRVSEALRTMVSSGEWRKAVRANLPGPEVIGTQSYADPEVTSCTAPPTSSTTSSTSSTSSASSTSESG